MRDLFNQEEEKKEKKYKEKHLITKENIIENFGYEELVALEKVLENKFVSLHTTRLDLTAKKEPLVKRNEEYGIVRYGCFYSEKRLKEKVIEIETIAEVVALTLELKKLQLLPMEKPFSSKEHSLVYYGTQKKQVWQIILEDEKWYLVRLKDQNLIKDIEWGD